VGGRDVSNWGGEQEQGDEENAGRKSE